MTIHYRLSVLAIAFGLALSAGCAAAVTGAAGSVGAADGSTESALDGASTTSESVPADSAPAALQSPGPVEPPVESTATAQQNDPTGARDAHTPDASIDEATLAWADASCTDLLTLAPILMAFPDSDADAAPDEYAIANIDYYDSIGTAVKALVVDIDARPQPGIARGDLVHTAYVTHMNALGAAASEGAKEIELLRRSGSATDLASKITQVQAAVDALISTDFGGPLLDDVEISDAIDAAMHAAPACQALD